MLDSLNSAYQRRIARSLRKAAGVALGYVPQANKRILEADAVIGDVPERVEEAIRLDDLNAMPTGPDPQEVARSRREARDFAWREAMGRAGRRTNNGAR